MVQDYLQLGFDGNRLTFNIWPRASIPDREFCLSTPGYRDALCSLIAKEVESVYAGDDRVEISFSDKSRVSCDLLEKPGDEGDRVLFFAADPTVWASC